MLIRTCVAIATWAHAHAFPPPPRTRAGSFTESRGEIRFPEISTHVLEKVIQYFHYKARFAGSSAPIPEYPIEPEVALELLMAANYLDC